MINIRGQVLHCTKRRPNVADLKLFFTMEEFLGKKYALTTSENFEDYLVFIGKGYLHRKAARSLRQEHWLTRNEDGTYTFSFSSPLTSVDITFTSGEEFEETKPDGVKVKSLITIEDNKMIHIQTEENGRISKHIREFYPDKMIVITTAEGYEKTAIRHYVLVE